MTLKGFCSLLFTTVSMDSNSNNKIGFGTVLVAEKHDCKSGMIPARDHCFTLSPDFTHVFSTISINKDTYMKNEFNDK